MSACCRFILYLTSFLHTHTHPGSPSRFKLILQFYNMYFLILDVNTVNIVNQNMQLNVEVTCLKFDHLYEFSYFQMTFAVEYL